MRPSISEGASPGSCHGDYDALSTPGLGAEAMAELLGGSSTSARGLARSVAHRLKYYIDVKRKEDSFDSSGVVRDGTESSSLYNIKDNKQLEHDFAEIKLEAFLRAYLGSTEECNRKVQKSAGRQKDLEKLIKKMAQDYVPDKSNEGRGKRTKRQRRSLITAARLHAIATPFMSPEEVRRLVSSASKLIVAATSEASPEEPGTPRESVLSPERKDPENIQHLGHGSTQCPPFTCFPKDEAKAIQKYSEEAVKKHLEKNGRKKSNRTKKDKNEKEIRRPADIATNISSNAHKSEGFFSRRFPTPSDTHSPNAGFASPYLQTGQNKVYSKGILRSRASSACTPSAISEYHNEETNVQWKKTSPSQQNVESGHSRKPFQGKRQKSADRPIGAVASVRSCRSHRLLKTQPVLSTRNPPAVKGRNRKAHSAKPTAEAIRTESSTVREKAGVRCNSTVVSKSWLLKGQGDNTSCQLDQSSIFAETSPSDWPKQEQGSKKNMEGLRVHFQKLPHESIPGTTEWKHHGLDSWSVGNVRGLTSSDQTQPIVAEGKCPELVKYLQDQKKEPVPTATNGPSFLYQVCQGMGQGAPTGLTLSKPAKTDGHFQPERTPRLFKRFFLSNEPGGRQANEDSAGKMQEPCSQPTAPSPPATLDSCRCSEPPSDCEIWGEQGAGSPLITAAVFERWGDEFADEEFTISSASGSSSARSFGSLQEQMNGNANVDFKEEQQSAKFSTETFVQKILNAMQEESATPQEIFCQREKLSSSAEEDGTDKNCGKNGCGVSRVVYFSQLPTSI